MEFYTNVVQAGDKILVRGYEHGRPYQRRIDFAPTLFVNSKTQSKWQTLDGIYVDEVQPGTIRETRDFVKRYDGVAGFAVYGQTNYAYQYLSDTYDYDINWDMEQIKVFTIDIETRVEGGFPDIRSASEEITLITIKDLFTKKVITWGYSPTGSAFKNERKDVEYRNFDTEMGMLKDFIIWWQGNYPDVVTGWNTDFFDVPYLIKRLTRELGESLAKKISPWGMITERNTFIKGNEELHFDISGIAQLDYLELYKKYTYTKQESYRLDYIAEQELGDRKKENPGETFRDFYMDHWQTFVEYNIHDVELVDKLEDKMRLLELHLTMAYQAKINYEDVYSQVRMWDAIIYNHLRKKGIVIPMKVNNGGKDGQFEGAYVKDVIVGQHKWVVSFDLNSLYPHLIMQYNISPETLTHEKISCTVDQLLNQQIDTSYAKRRDLSMTANGWCYRRDIKGFMPELMETMYANRSKFKKQMLKVQQQYEHDKGNNDLRKEISRLNNLQMAMKIALNSAYGAMGNQYFRYFDIRMAEGITTSGQLSIRWMADEFNRYMNKIMKSDNKDYVIAIDTDSIYLSMEDLVEKVAGDKDTAGKIKYMDKVCEEIFQPFIDNTYQKLAEYMNAYSQKMIMKREVLADKGIWIGKKNYILNVHNSEGVQFAKPKQKVMGLAMVRSSTPSVIRQELKNSVNVILEGSEKNTQKYIADYKAKFNQFSPAEIAFPRGVSGLKQYAGSPIYQKGTPIHVRAALLYNHYVKKLGIDKKYQYIREGDKIKFVYLRTPNPYHENVIAFLTELPKEFGLEQFIDYDTQFDKTFVEPLKTIIEPLNWQAEEVSSLEDFFG
jgi:DNA polymerase elongation subunit (family B)